MFLGITYTNYSLMVYIHIKITNMAVTQNTLIGRSRGSVGGTTFSKWKGLNTLRSKALTVENPQTDAQMAQRSKMTLMVAAYRNLAPAISVGMVQQAINMSEYNAFTSINLKNSSITGSYPTFAIDPEALEISKGSLTNTAIATAVCDQSNGTTVVTWSATAVVDQSDLDLAFVVLWNTTLDTYSFSLGTATRTVGTVTFANPAGTVAGNDVVVYLFFFQESSSKAGDNAVLAITAQA